MSPARARRPGRREAERIEHLQREFAVSREVAVFMLRRDRDRVRHHTPPPELVREIRAEVRRAEVGR